VSRYFENFSRVRDLSLAAGMVLMALMISSRPP